MASFTKEMTKMTKKERKAKAFQEGKYNAVFLLSTGCPYTKKSMIKSWSKGWAIGMSLIMDAQTKIMNNKQI